MADGLEVITSSFVKNASQLKNLLGDELSKDAIDLLKQVQNSGTDEELIKLLYNEVDKHTPWKAEDLKAFLEVEKIQLLYKLGLLTEESPFYDLFIAVEDFGEDDSEASSEVGDWTIEYNDNSQEVWVYYKDVLALKINYQRHTVEYVNEIGLPLYQVASVMDASSFYTIQ